MLQRVQLGSLKRVGKYDKLTDCKAKCGQVEVPGTKQRATPNEKNTLAIKGALVQKRLNARVSCRLNKSSTDPSICIVGSFQVLRTEKKAGPASLFLHFSSSLLCTPFSFYYSLSWIFTLEHLEFLPIHLHTVI